MTSSSTENSYPFEFAVHAAKGMPQPTEFQAALQATWFVTKGENLDAHVSSVSEQQGRVQTGFRLRSRLRGRRAGFDRVSRTGPFGLKVELSLQSQ